jgi:hypothetical protein
MGQKKDVKMDSRPVIREKLLQPPPEKRIFARNPRDGMAIAISDGNGDTVLPMAEVV